MGCAFPRYARRQNPPIHPGGVKQRRMGRAPRNPSGLRRQPAIVMGVAMLSPSYALSPLLRIFRLLTSVNFIPDVTDVCLGRLQTKRRFHLS